MKSTKTLLYATAVAVAMATSFQSCKKIVSVKKLDGTWKLTSGTVTTTDDSDGNGKKTISKNTYDGVNVTNSYTNESNIVKETKSSEEVKFTFDKKAGTYQKVTVNKTTTTDTAQTSFTLVGATYVPGTKYDRKTEKTSTVTEDGVFTISGGTGEIEKNSQVILSVTTTKSVNTYAYSYFVKGTSTVFDITGKYYMSGWGPAPTYTPTYDLLKSSKTEDVTTTSKTNTPEKWDVVGIEDGVMNIVFENSYKTVNGVKTYESSTVGDLKLTHEEK